MTSDPPQEILIVGLGAVGTIYGYILKNSTRVRVTIVARSNHAIVQANGVHIKSGKYGDMPGWKPHRLCKTVAEAADRAYAYVIVTTKAIPDIMRTPQLLAAILTPEYIEKYEQPVYVIMQNGLNVEMDLFAALKALGKVPKILGSALYINANQLQGNVVEHSDFGWISLGIYREDHSVIENSPEDEILLKGFADIVNAGGGIAKTWPSIQRIRFTKNLWNLTFSSFCTLTGYPLPSLFRAPPKDGDTYEVYVSESTRDLILEYTLPTIKAMMEEYVTLGHAMDLSEPGTGVTSDFVDYMIKETAAIHVKADSTHLPSMLLDAENGRPMELEVIIGEVVRMAKGAGVAVPRIEMMYAMLVVVQNQIVRKQELETRAKQS
ncbi:6-phosphogluconate dehydrogenase C-terminal domain-like protein [Athelia psychrophila]|uniref:6-phosphogluconate dehydrogenase C-terminal domain-like protein n=1 Tax=Athelia psychrophila TaxID=1759441 RepID=A0A166KSK5_9AGAM|nr:6-phosphogluconate dehydrogenase C-terminal domain-like protein [Fibularhizoctonia sp. CBS 109695]